MIPLASDLLMLAPHLAAVWMAYRRRPFWSGVLAGVAFWISPKGALGGRGVRACGIRPALPGWPRGSPRSSGAARGWLGGGGRARRLLGGGLAMGTAVRRQHLRRIAARNGVVRTLNWVGLPRRRS